jgi:5-methylcytosine-specific restriction endonuclease McrA
MATIYGNPTEWDRFYKTGRWQRLRATQLRRHPLCKFCLERSIVTPTNVVNHVTPHKDVTGERQSLCEQCHESAKRRIELRGHRIDMGLDGLPTDPNHRLNRAR